MILHILVIVIEFQKLVSGEPHEVINFFIVVSFDQDTDILGHLGFHVNSWVFFLFVKINWGSNLIDGLTPD